ncbi:hypothetical protein M5D96_005637, partial [Drosophila gunungcola]
WVAGKWERGQVGGWWPGWGPSWGPSWWWGGTSGAHSHRWQIGGWGTSWWPGGRQSGARSGAHWGTSGCRWWWLVGRWQVSRSGGGSTGWGP